MLVGICRGGRAAKQKMRCFGKWPKLGLCFLHGSHLDNDLGAKILSIALLLTDGPLSAWETGAKTAGHLYNTQRRVSQIAKTYCTVQYSTQWHIVQYPETYSTIRICVTQYIWPCETGPARKPAWTIHMTHFGTRSPFRFKLNLIF